ncbi:hypothetical protein niasHT_006428 [Heterodera trifolii]|uniref:Uncharacterized protein n=1 Tax=Heterodera trifolii TaxID=157864 RepID=A0ABD2M2U9_9BILA
MDAYVLPQLNAFPPTQQQQQQQLIFPHEQEFHAQLQQECSSNDIYGVNNIIELDFATGTMTIPNFSDNDVGSYTFPLEQSNFSAMNGPNGCELQGIGCTTLKLFKMENNDE